jgi:ABC-type transport system involved in multi-copper enzyme maturation permease subunit
MLSLLLAEMGRSFRRRAVWLIALITLGVLLTYSWSNHYEVSDLRGQIRLFEQVQHLQETAETPQEESPGLNEQIESYRTRIDDRRIQLAPEQSHFFLLRFFGTAVGVFISMVLASTVVGADFRWSYWKTLTAHEPRRARVVLAKVVTIWLFILVGLAIVLGLSYPVNSLFAQIYDVRPFGGSPQADLLLDDLGRAWVVNGTYATLAAAIVLATRSNLAGLVGSLALLGIDGLVSGRVPVPSYRFGSPAQQVAALFPKPIALSSFADVPGAQWFAPMQITRVIERTPNSISLEYTPLAPIPPEQAVVVLICWSLVFLLLAALAMKSRDIPA